MKAKDLHEKALEISKTYLQAEGQLIEILQTIDSMRAYRDLGYKSLFDYTIQALGLSEGIAYNLITVARKACEVPALKEKIQAQEMTLSNARMIAPVLTPENQEKWISAAQSLSKRELEKEIAKENPKLAIQETTRPVGAERVELRIGISEELERKFKRVQDLVSSKTKSSANLEETLEVLVDLYLEREDPIEKAKRAKSPVPGQVKTESPNPERRRLSAHYRLMFDTRSFDAMEAGVLIKMPKDCVARRNAGSSFITSATSRGEARIRSKISRHYAELIIR